MIWHSSWLQALGSSCPQSPAHISHDTGGMHPRVHLPLLRKVHRHWEFIYMKSSCAHRAKSHPDLFNWKSSLRWFYTIWSQNLSITVISLRLRAAMTVPASPLGEATFWLSLPESTGRGKQWMGRGICFDKLWLFGSTQVPALCSGLCCHCVLGQIHPWPNTSEMNGPYSQLAKKDIKVNGNVLV